MVQKRVSFTMVSGTKWQLPPISKIRVGIILHLFLKAAA